MISDPRPICALPPTKPRPRVASVCALSPALFKLLSERAFSCTELITIRPAGELAGGVVILEADLEGK